MPPPEEIDVDNVSIDAIKPALQKRTRSDKEREERTTPRNEKSDYDRMIEERMRRLRDRSLSPDKPEQEVKRRQTSTSPVPRRDSNPPSRGGSKTPIPEGDNREQGMTKIEQQLEKARLMKERSLRQAKEDAKLDKKKLGRRRREFDIMRTTNAHWSTKSLPQMTERDWRILREDFEIQISGAGSSCPYPLRSWEEAYKEKVIPPQIMESIKEAGYKHPSPVQMACIPIGLRRLDVMGVAETGSGKTCAFVIPLIHYVSEQPPMNDSNKDDGPYAIIMCPNRELAAQITDEAERFAKPYSFRTTTTVGGASLEDQGSEISKGSEIVIGTPGRMCDLLDRRYLVFNQCNYVVLDEADSMVKEGMEEQVMTVLNEMPSSNEKPAEEEDEDASMTYRVTVMFSATMPPALESIAKRHLRRPVKIKIGLSSPSDIKQSIHILNDEKVKKSAIIQLIHTTLGEISSSSLILVFANLKTDVELVSSLLSDEGISVGYSHGGLDQREREHAIMKFREGEVRVLVATDMLARGIDIKRISHVINYDMPKGTEAIERYSQRIGRTGRAGMKGDAISFVVLKNDTDILYALKQKLESEGQVVPPLLSGCEAARYPPGTRDNQKSVVYARGGK
eukprot:TRINITY_DN13472_c0_g1_i1.p1 TRINITY_DN13472_c0_g1~~TRINITY_DN13472_c0_g1_i1.p1  ORF type:complete len:638 (+),score=148.70 TRINITY_DN13472_c0_g1_i1:49-1914(+)